MVVEWSDFYHFGLARTFLAERRDSQTAVACTSSVLLPRASLSDLRDAPAAAATQAVDAPLWRTRRLASRGGERQRALHAHGARGAAVGPRHGQTIAVSCA